MRAETLVFFHVLAGAALVGAVLAAAILSSGGEVAARLAFRSSVLVLGATLATIALGEAARAREDVEGAWLDTGSLLAYIGLVFPGIGLALVTHRAQERPRLRRFAAVLAGSMLLVAIAAAFVMAAKP